MTQLTVCTDMVANALVSIRKEMLAAHSLGDARANCWRIRDLAAPALKASGDKPSVLRMRGICDATDTLRFWSSLPCQLSCPRMVTHTTAHNAARRYNGSMDQRPGHRQAAWPLRIPFAICSSAGVCRPSRI
jgi:hypothetical protein